MYIRRFLFFVLFSGGIGSTLYAQFTKNLEIGASGGIMVYQGDLTPSPGAAYRTPGGAFQAYVSRNISSKMAVRLQLGVGGLRGDDALYDEPEWRQQRAFRFRTTVVEASALAVWYPIGHEKKLAPYLMAGAGLASLTIRRDWSRLNADYFPLEDPVRTGLDEDVARQMPGIIPVIPAGIGLRYAVSPRVSLFTETAYRFTWSDYIDGFSKSAGPTQDDHFMSHVVGVSFSLGKRPGVDCPVIRQ